MVDGNDHGQLKILSIFITVRGNTPNHPKSPKTHQTALKQHSKPIQYHAKSHFAEFLFVWGCLRLVSGWYLTGLVL